MDKFFDHTACYLERLDALDVLYAEVVIYASSHTNKYDNVLFDFIEPALDRLKVNKPNSEIEDVVEALVEIAQSLTVMGASFKSLKVIENISEAQVSGFWARIRFVFKHRKSVSTWLKTGGYY